MINGASFTSDEMVALKAAERRGDKAAMIALENAADAREIAAEKKREAWRQLEALKHIPPKLVQ